MTALANGQSEIDTVVLRLPDYGKEIRNWSRYSYNQAFLTPTAGWSFAVSDEDTTLADMLVPGARVELCINDNVQCSGYLEKHRIDSDSGDGTVVTVWGRDILGPVVDATMDPKFVFAAGITVPELVLAVLKPFGITKVYNADLFNIYVVSGFDKGRGPGQPYTVKQAQQHTTIGADGKLTLDKEAVDATVYVSPLRPDLRALSVTDRKPHAGESVWS
ncbi:MAG: phage tail protein, partial [Myxococcaceae bacterium]|nr:phage tail protein [Myxococcaceae bacterium]